MIELGNWLGIQSRPGYVVAATFLGTPSCGRIGT